jgi:hypothetical protein
MVNFEKQQVSFQLTCFLMKVSRQRLVSSQYPSLVNFFQYRNEDIYSRGIDPECLFIVRDGSVELVAHAKDRANHAQGLWPEGWSPRSSDKILLLCYTASSCSASCPGRISWLSAAAPIFGQQQVVATCLQDDL